MNMIKLYEKADGTFGQGLTAANTPASTIARSLTTLPGVGRGVLFFGFLSRPVSEISEVSFAGAPVVANNLPMNTAIVQEMIDFPLNEGDYIRWKERPAATAAAEVQTSEGTA